MKRILSYVLLLVLLGGTSIWGYNNIDNNRDTLRSKWGKRESRDELSVLETYGRSEVDVDYPGEHPLTDLIQRYGIDYEAVAEVITYVGSTEGEYSLSVEAVSSPRRRTNKRWSGVTYEKLKDTYFQRLSGDEASNMNRTKVRQKLADCEASSKIKEDAGSYQSVAKVN